MTAELSVTLSLGIPGKQLRSIRFAIDDFTMSDILVHWRDREMAQIELEARGISFSAQRLMEKAERRREFVRHLGSMIASRIDAILEDLEDEKP